MQSFIKTVLVDLKRKNLKLENLHFILPSKRAGVFLKYQLSTLIDYPIFAPEILSIEAFVEELSGLQNLPNTDLLFKLYEAYLQLTSEKEQEPFESFLKWAQILLQDFNEVDRFLVSQDRIFSSLNDIQQINNWTLEGEQTDLVKNYLKFWQRLKDYYSVFTESLLQSKQGYQGLIYREAAENIQSYVENNRGKIHIFLGFNALNTSESQIIQELLQNDLAHVYWDIDEYFIEDPVHDVGFFMRQYLKDWSYFRSNSFNWKTSNYHKSKNIQVVGIPKLVGQAKYIGQLLNEISVSNKDLKSVAIILGEENLLTPLLNSIPKSISHLNVTMGLPLKYVPLASLFTKLISIHKNNPTHFYYKDIIDILSHPSVHYLFESGSSNASSDIIAHIQKNNIVYISSGELQELSGASSVLISVLFESWQGQPKSALEKCSELIFSIKSSLDSNKSLNRLELEYLYRFNSLFNQLIKLNNTHNHLTSISALHGIFNELLSMETLDFKGEPLEGLQIMGMLESRVLDFETVIISSVNEGILPSGKTNNSFIPFDVKIQENLPTYKEKDAVYAYHFFRLLQRAKNVYILYNTEVDALKGGEKSRFITQLEIEGIHEMDHKIISPNIPNVKRELKHINKTPEVIENIKALATKGFSPSSLTNYMRNPMDFYFDKILNIEEFEDVEENIAANTLGSVIHNTLEDFYKPLEGHFLTIDLLKSFKDEIEPTTIKHFKKLYNKGDFTKGKNLIIFEIAQRYISNFINSEIEGLNNGDQIKILKIEADETIEFKIESLDFPIRLTGKVDRIDQFNGITRVIDYKSGKVLQNQVEVINWEDLTEDYDKYSKSFQVLCYAYIMHIKKQIELPVEAGIISFKNLNEGFLKFAKKDKAGSWAKKEQLISQDTLDNFEKQLKKLILEICDPTVNFIEKELNYGH
ncbi:PD-(D/E)XK nuclease family protein [Winogradskyella flava]|uniref:PD-(D/E)XK nuclease family protein n=1 Tax=Winogradskyella flava TaxID=1884876 RepID=A0A842IP49_9FLAO|nr:PD-(D/E)XK nuclease family protein [Winogradskyella flava]MBC2843979.1 PD-(D/E)XK nuclease family protein [Winogradskyella flava]